MAFERVLKIAKSDYKLRHACPSVRMEKFGIHWTDFYKIWYLNFSKTCRENSCFIQNRARITGTLREDQFTVLIISRLFLPRIRNVADKSCRENQNTHFQ